jgi:acyl-CoA dehydrogenase
MPNSRPLGAIHPRMSGVPFANWYRAARAARIADGPDEVHDMVIGRDYLKGTFRPLI